MNKAQEFLSMVEGIKVSQSHDGKFNVGDKVKYKIKGKMTTAKVTEIIQGNSGLYDLRMDNGDEMPGEQVASWPYGQLGMVEGIDTYDATLKKMFNKS